MYMPAAQRIQGCMAVSNAGAGSEPPGPNNWFELKAGSPACLSPRIVGWLELWMPNPVELWPAGQIWHCWIPT